MIINLDLPHSYEIEVLEEMPGGGGPEQVIFYPGASRLGGGDGIPLLVVPRKSDPWVGIFAFGYESAKVFHGVLACPHENYFCAVSSGLGVIVSAEKPDDWKNAPVYPIQDARAVKNKKILLFHDFNYVAAWGEKGQLWKSEKASSKEIKILELAEDSVTLEGWSAPDNKKFTMRLNLDNGTTEYKDPGIASLER